MRVILVRNRIEELDFMQTSVWKKLIDKQLTTVEEIIRVILHGMFAVPI